VGEAGPAGKIDDLAHIFRWTNTGNQTIKLALDP
jgi:hypothetical protein